MYLQFRRFCDMGGISQVKDTEPILELISKNLIFKDYASYVEPRYCAVCSALMDGSPNCKLKLFATWSGTNILLGVSSKKRNVMC